MTVVAADPALVALARDRIVREGGAVTVDRLAQVLRDSGVVLGSTALIQTAQLVRDELLGAGPLQPLLDDPQVTDVLVNGPDQVWVDRAGRLEPTEVRLGDVLAVRMLAVRLAATGGERLDDARPMVDARLPDGTRLHAVLPPVADGCAAISLRVVRHRPFTLDQLVASETLTELTAEVLRELIEVRANVIVSGATGTGKTTLLSSLLSEADPGERIVCIEESGELVPRHPHVVRLLVRRPNVEGAGGVGLADLVRESLRMRPDRVVLGECRGAEVREVLGAMNTGHDGGCTTVHANAATEVPARLEALGALAGMSREAVSAQAASALDAVVHLRREAACRWVAEIGAVHRDQKGSLSVLPAVVTVRNAPSERGPGWPLLAERIGQRR